jgi:ABC-type polar amino acid transport system ATPase subunit
MGDATRGQPLLSVVGLTKSYRNTGVTVARTLQGDIEAERTKALHNISFEVHRGEVLALMGPSGSGKSTCLRTINALETIDSGRIVLCGHDLAAPGVPMHVARRKTAMVFQHFELFPHLTVLDNVALALRLTQGINNSEANRLALQALDSVGMGSFAKQNPSRLSGGQKQRVAIARALAVQPEILLCDEPTSALDPELVGDIAALLAQIAATGMTMIVVTHEMAFARRVSTRCLFLEKGLLLADLPSPEFFACHGSPQADSKVPQALRARVAQFLGQMERN